MLALLVFAVVLLLGVLVSELAHRSVLSTAVLFLVAGFVVGEGVLGLVPLRADDPLEFRLAELALFSVLFSDGMKAGLPDLRSAWQLPGRALLLGLPLTLLGNALLAHYLVGLEWVQAFLVGAVLAPTDPVFAAAIVGRAEVPRRLRQLLNVESGLNDGLALPVVVVLLALASRAHVHALEVAWELALGVILGVAIPLAALKLEQTRFFAATQTHRPLLAFAIGLLLYALCSMTHANAFLAAFAGGATVATVDTRVRDAFHEFGELLAELFKLGALLVFGALISPKVLSNVSLGGYAFALGILVLVRPLALAVALPPRRLARRGRFSTREWAAAAWFGPKGFASVVYGLLVLASGIPGAEKMFHLIAISIVLSILLHSSTDVIVARWFNEEAPEAEEVAAST